MHIYQDSPILAQPFTAPHTRYMTSDPYYTQKIPGSSATFRMLQVPGGSFQMGSLETDKSAFSSEKPQHPVKLNPFLMGEYTVTQELWEAIMGENPSDFKGQQRPVENVSWFDAAVFCNALSEKTGRKAVYVEKNGQPFGKEKDHWALPNDGRVQRDLKANGYRLPTEAEWEFAAKGGDIGENGHTFEYAGSDLLEQVGWYDKNSNQETQEVRLLLPNALGLYDMSGNVWEWCADWHADYKPGKQDNPQGPEQGVYRVFRGGGWNSAPRRCRTASRYHYGPAARDGALGFRLVLQSVG
jgi:formylglycine-generating enzyme